MANQFIDLPVPAASGDGASIDVSALGGFRTISVNGDFGGGQIIIQVSQDGTNWSDFLTFTESRKQSVFVAAAFMRVRVAGATAAVAANADIASFDSGTLAGAIAAPAGDGAGAPLDVSLFGEVKTVVVTGDWTGTLIVQISLDGVSWVDFFVFQGGNLIDFPGPAQSQSGFLTAQAVRVRRLNSNPAAPGTATVSIGGASASAAAGGIAGVNVEDAGVPVATQPTLNFFNALVVNNPAQSRIDVTQATFSTDQGYIDVTQAPYNCVADGKTATPTDNRAALTQAITDALASSKALLLPKGGAFGATKAPGTSYTFLLDGIQNLTIYGRGFDSEICKIGDGGGTEWNLFEMVNGASFITLDNLTLNGNKGVVTNTTASDRLIKLDATGGSINDFDARRLTLTNDAGHGLELVTGGGNVIQRYGFRTFRVTDCDGDGLRFNEGCNFGIYDGCWFIDNAGVQIRNLAAGADRAEYISMRLVYLLPDPSNTNDAAILGRTTRLAVANLQGIGASVVVDTAEDFSFEDMRLEGRTAGAGPNRTALRLIGACVRGKLTDPFLRGDQGAAGGGTSAGLSIEASGGQAPSILQLSNLDLEGDDGLRITGGDDIGFDGIYAQAAVPGAGRGCDIAAAVAMNRLRFVNATFREFDRNVSAAGASAAIDLLRLVHCQGSLVGDAANGFAFDGSANPITRLYLDNCGGGDVALTSVPFYQIAGNDPAFEPAEFVGDGSPNGVVVADIGARYIDRSAAGPTNIDYRKTAGSGLATGWTVLV